MDIIVEGYLKRFIDEFGLDEKEKDINFEKMCFYAILNNELNYLDDDDLSEISVGKNKGIDGICLSIDGKIITNISEIDDLKADQRNFEATLYFIQAKSSSKFSDAEIGNFCDTVIEFLSPKPKYTLTTQAEMYHKIFVSLLELISYMKSFSCKLFYCSTGVWNNATSCASTIQIKGNSIKQKNIFNVIEINPVDGEKLRKLYDKANHPLSAEFIFSMKTTLEKIERVKEAYIGVLPFNEFLKIIVYQETNTLKPLFSDNVRDFLGVDEKVNESIDRTLKEKKFALFQLFNNGVTIIAEENISRGDTFKLSNYQIVNGCQTANVLYVNRNMEDIDKLLIPIKLIITDDEGIRDKIIVSTNNQTQIKEEQLLALTSFQKGLEEYYKGMGDGIYYERRKAQYAPEPKIKKKNIIDIREQIKTFVAMFLDEPHVVSGYFGKVYKDKSSQIFLREHKYDAYYISGLTHVTFKTLLNLKKIDRKYNKARYHIYMLLRKIAEPSEKVGFANKKMKNYCEEIIKILRNKEECLKSILSAIEIIEIGRIDINDQKEIYKKSTTIAL